jgi:hypothetical protein
MSSCGSRASVRNKREEGKEKLKCGALSVRIDCVSGVVFKWRHAGAIQRCPKHTVIMSRRTTVTGEKQNKALAEMMHPIRAQSGAVGSIATLLKTHHKKSQSIPPPSLHATRNAPHQTC